MKSKIPDDISDGLSILITSQITMLCTDSVEKNYLDMEFWAGFFSISLSLCFRKVDTNFSIANQGGKNLDWSIISAT